MMSPWPVPGLGLGSLPTGWRCAPAQQATGVSSVRHVSPAFGGRPRVSGPTAHVCSAPAMGTARPVTLRLVRGQGTEDLGRAGGRGNLGVALTLPAIGVCDCTDNTAGPHCEKCADGYYGDATAGTTADCQPCPCPGGSSCAAVPKTGEVVCTNCPMGTTGECAPAWEVKHCRVRFV